MTARSFGFVCAALAAACLLGGCRSEFHLVMFNNTNDQVICRRRPADLHPEVILACTARDVTDISTDDLTIERTGHIYHYHYPAAYAYPSAKVPPGYERKVRHLGKAFCLQLADNNRIYLLQRREAYTAFQHPDQPAGFPLSPWKDEAVAPAPPKKAKPPGFP